MKSKMIKRVISLLLCFSMLMPTFAVFAEEPSVNVVNTENEKYEIVDGSTIGQTTGQKYFVRFTKNDTYEIVSTKPTSGSYTTIVTAPSTRRERYLVSASKTEYYNEYVKEKFNTTKRVCIKSARNVPLYGYIYKITGYKTVDNQRIPIRKKVRVQNGTKYIPPVYAVRTYADSRIVKKRRRRTVPAVYGTRTVKVPGGTAYKIIVKGEWQVDLSSKVLVTVTRTWAPNGQYVPGYIKNSKTYLSNHRRLPNGYISYAGGVYYLKISEDRSQKSDIFEPSVYQRTGGKYHTSNQERQAQIDEEQRKAEQREYVKYQKQIKTALTKRLDEIIAIINSKSHLSGLLTNVEARQNYISTHKSNPKTWTDSGQRMSSIVLDGIAYNITTEQTLSDGFVYMVGDKYYVLVNGQPVLLNDFNESVYETSNGEYKTLEEQEENAKIPADIWTDGGVKVQTAYLLKGEYYISDESKVPTGYVIKVDGSFMYNTASGRSNISSFDLSTYTSSEGRWFNSYQNKLNALSYIIADKLNDGSAYNSFKQDFSETSETLKAKIDEIHSLYSYGLNTNDVNQTTNNLQRQLNKIGNTLVVDGKYGPATIEAVQAFQSENGLKTTKYADMETYNKIMGIIVPDLPDTISGLIEHMKNYSFDRDKVIKKIKLILSHSKEIIDEKSTTNTEDLQVLATEYDKVKDVDLSEIDSVLQSQVKLLIDSIKNKGPYYLKATGGVVSKRLFPVVLVGETFTTKMVYENWLSSFNPYSRLSKDQFANKVLEFVDTGINNLKYWLTQLNGTYLNDTSDPAYIVKKNELIESYNGLFIEFEKMFKSLHLKSENYIYQEFISGGINNINKEKLDTLKLFLLTKYAKEDELAEGFEDGVTEDIKSIISLLGSSKEFSELVVGIFTDAEVQKAMSDMFAGFLKENSTTLMMGYISGGVIGATGAMMSKLIWNMIKDVIKTTIERIEEKSLAYNVGYFTGKIVYEVVSGVLTAGVFNIVGKIAAKAISLGIDSVEAISKFVIKATKTKAFESAVDILKDKSGYIDINSFFDIKSNKETLSKLVDEANDIIDNSSELVDNVIEATFEGVSNLDNIGVKYSDDVMGYTYKQGKYTPVEVTLDNYEQLDNIANNMYSTFRNSTDDISAIAQNTGWDLNDVEQIKKHIFLDELKLDDGIRRLDPDYEMAQAWDRLSKGEYFDHDVLLLKHELYESTFYQMNDVTQRAAHDAANEIFNWQGFMQTLE